MKFYILFALLISTNLFASKLQVSNDKYNQILNDPVVKPLYEECVNANSNDLSTCVWDKLSQNPDQKEAIMTKYFSDDSETKYSTTTIKTVDKESDKAIKKLEDYMYNKLQEAFYGDVSAATKGTKVVDHRVFYSLYKNQVSKNIITAISSYCIEAEASRTEKFTFRKKDGTTERLPYFIIPKDDAQREIIRTSNIQKLKEVSGTSSDQNLAYGDWGNCLLSISKVCTMSASTDDEKYSRGRACVASNYLKQLRQALIAAETTEKEFDSHQGASAFKVSAEIYRGTGRGKNIDDLTSITSNEFVNKSGYKKELEAKQAIIAQCRQSGDYEPCQKFLNSGEDKEQLDQALSEYDLRGKLLNEKLRNMQDEELKKYLEEEGRSQQEIERALASDESKQRIKNQINDSFEKEKEAIKQQIRDKITGSTVDQNLQGQALADAIENKFDTINQELSQQAESYTQLIHYNNIVSGFLSVEDSSGRSVGSNVQSINRELSDSAYNGEPAADGARVPASGNSNYMEELSEKLSEMVKGKSGDVDEEKESTPISTGTINQNIFQLDYGDDQTQGQQNNP